VKVFAISDLHLSINNPKPMDIFGPVWDDYVDKIVDSWGKKVTDSDVVLIAGDISWAMDLKSAALDLDFLGNLKGKKVMVRGNHDYWWKSISALRASLPPNFFALQNDCIRIGDYLFCGSRGWNIEPESADDKKILDRELIRIKLSLDAMQKQRVDGDKVVLLTHFPPFNFKKDRSLVTDLIKEYSVDKVVYGHLHGKYVLGSKRETIDNAEYILSSCDQIDNDPVEIY